MRVRSGHRRAALSVGWLALVLAGCQQPHVINDLDARACELQGLPRGSDANADCATKREEDRIAAGGTPAAQPSAPSTPMPSVPPPPPAHPGSIAQTTPLTVAPGITATINFFAALNPDCSVDGQMTVRIDKPPANGTARVTPRDDYARATQNGLPPACIGRKVAGVAVDYTPANGFLGTDSLEFETLSKTGAKAVFRVPIKVEIPKKDDDDD